LKYRRCGPTSFGELVFACFHKMPPSRRGIVARNMEIVYYRNVK